MLKFYRIKGNSLYPEYQNGDYVLVTRSPFALAHLKVGQVIAFRHAIYGLMIKKIARIDPQTNMLDVHGTILESIDSRQFGPITRQDILGKVIWHIPAPRKRP